MEAGLHVELATTLLEKIFETLSEQIHHHHVVHLAVLSLLVTHKVQEGHEGLSTELVNELALPEEHDVPLHLHGFLLFIAKLHKK